MALPSTALLVDGTLIPTGHRPTHKTSGRATPKDDPAAGKDHQAPNVAPPSTVNSCMVMCEASSDNKNATAEATSRGVANFPNGIPFRKTSGRPPIVASFPVASRHMEVSMGVAVDPGATKLHRTPCTATSNPRLFVNMEAAALEAAYAAISARGVPAALEATVTTAPSCRPTIREITARDMLNTPVTLTEKTSSQSSSEKSQTDPNRNTPAPFTRYRMGPNSSSIKSTTDETEALSVTSTE